MIKALKSKPTVGEIAIRNFNDEIGRFHFEIADNGIGIEPERLDSLFTAFEQADASVNRRFGGLGLGLAICKHLVELHHGTIEAESRGRSFGAMFKVTLEALPEGVETIDLDFAGPKAPGTPL